MNKYEWRLENRESFYDTLVEWWKLWGFPVLPKNQLPTRIFVASVLVTSSETMPQWEDIYAIPVYVSDSDMCWLGFPTSNPAVKSQWKEGALEYLMDKLETCIKYQGYSKIITTSFTPKLMKLFEDRGFVVSDEKTTYFTKEL